MERVWGYARISTQLQNLERQVRNILAFDPSAEIIQETYSGRNSSRPKFQKLLKTVQAGDTIIFDSVSRMSRNAAEGISLYKEQIRKYSRSFNGTLKDKEVIAIINAGLRVSHNTYYKYKREMYQEGT